MNRCPYCHQPLEESPCSCWESLLEQQPSHQRTQGPSHLLADDTAYAIEQEEPSAPLPQKAHTDVTRYSSSHWKEIKDTIAFAFSVLKGGSQPQPPSLSRMASAMLFGANGLMLLLLSFSVHRSFQRLLGVSLPYNSQRILLPLALLIIHILVQSGFIALFATHTRHLLTLDLLLSISATGTLYWSVCSAILSLLLLTLPLNSGMVFLAAFGVFSAFAYSLLLLYHQLSSLISSKQRRTVAAIITCSVQLALSFTALASQQVEMFQTMLSVFFS